MSNTGYPRSSHRSVAERRRTLILIVLIVGFAAAYLTWRIPAGSTTSSSSNDRLLLLSGVVAAIVAVLNIRTFPAQRDGWILIGLGSISWSIAHFMRSSSSPAVLLVYTGLFLLTALFLGTGCMRLAGMGRGPGGFRQLGIDLVPPIIALVTTVWLVNIGPFLDQIAVSSYVAISAVVHGIAAVALIVVGLAGFASWQAYRSHPATQSLMAGLAIIALADALWLQRWIDRAPAFGMAADIAFCIGFVTIATAGLQARLTPHAHATLPERPGVVAARLTRHAAPLSLLLLLILAGGQARWGELTAHGGELTVIAGIAVVLFAMMWENLVVQRETVLTHEIDSLSERIDGLISQVGRDPLTGLLNRRAFQDRLEHELQDGRAADKPVAIALIDVDNFKQINDTLGHAVGDQVLQAVASILIGACRTSDIAARYAGDEFVMIFPGVDEQTAGHVCHRIVESVRLINDQLSPESGVRVTLSVGVAITYRCKRNVAQLVAIADAAMYDAKEGGKDRVVAVDADTLTAAAYWGADPAASAAWSARQSQSERRLSGGRSQSRTAS